MQHVPGQLVGRDIVADLADLRRVGDQGAYELVQAMLRMLDVVAAVQPGHDRPGGMMGEDLRIGPEHRLEAGAGAGGAIAYLRQVLQVAGDLAVVPGRQDGLGVGKVGVAVVLAEFRADMASLLVSGCGKCRGR